MPDGTVGTLGRAGAAVGDSAAVTDAPWTDDVCSLVDAYRAGERSPREELEATLAAIEGSRLNCFSHLDPERALAAADDADLSLPFGGVPIGVPMPPMLAA